MIIRESFSFFVNSELLYGNISLVNYFLNLLALSYLQNKDPKVSRDTRFYPIEGRLLVPIEEVQENEKDLYRGIFSLIEIINQGTTYSMLYNTFMSFIEDLNVEEIEQEMVINDLRRYLSNDPEEIAAPIYLKKNTSNVLINLLKFGANASASSIAKELDTNQSTITRQITKISSKFLTVWRLEKNYSRLGLHSYIITIQFSKSNNSQLVGIYDELLMNKYIEQIYEGENDNFCYLYSVIHCPHIISEKIARKLSNYERNNIIDSFEISLIKDRIFRTCIVSSSFKPSKSNFEDLLTGKIITQKIVLWDSNHHLNKEKEFFDRKDEDILKFISIIISKSLTQLGLFGVHYNELQLFLEENNFDINKLPECQTFINKLQNRAYELDLIDYRFNISLTGIVSSNLCIFQITKNGNDEKISELVEKIAYFGWMLLIETSQKLFFLILGPTYNSYLAKLIMNEIKKDGFDFVCFSVKQKIFRYIDYSSLYDFSSQKWIL
ncbi:MAG: hypothetical protein JJE41_10990 [Candidatus Heimdallarchaeota archaeon]|nr:hypothetical protein [Candidatus Heimdallarchaeota archaeon]